MMTHSASKNSLGRKKGYDKLGKLEDEDDDGEEAEQNTTTNNNNGRKSDQRPKALLASASSSSSAAGGAATVVTRLRRCDRDWRDAADDDSDDDDGSADDSESNDSWGEKTRRDSMDMDKDASCFEVSLSLSPHSLFFNARRDQRIF